MTEGIPEHSEPLIVDGPPGLTYPHITRAQWAVLSAMTDQRCNNLMESADFVADLSAEAKEFLRNADKKKIDELNSNLEFFATSRAVWKFLLIGGATLVAFIVGASHAWKAIGEHISIKFK